MHGLRTKVLKPGGLRAGAEENEGSGVATTRLYMKIEA